MRADPACVEVASASGEVQNYVKHARPTISGLAHVRWIGKVHRQLGNCGAVAYDLVSADLQTDVSTALMSASSQACNGELRG